MSFSIYENALSHPRLGRYYNVLQYFETQTKDNQQLALNLYNLNLNLAASFYPVLSNFEVLLRNNINSFLSTHFNSTNWIIEQCKEDGYFSLPIFKSTIPLINSTLPITEMTVFKVREDIKEHYEKLNKDGNYTPDKLVARLSFGFWVHKFSSKEFIATDRSIHKCFTNRPKDTKQKDIFKGLYKILEFRNRVAHYEPILFDKEKIITTDKAKKIIELITQFSNWINPAFEILFTEHISKLTNQINDVDIFISKLTLVNSKENNQQNYQK
jgi:hypothetical protein